MRFSEIFTLVREASGKIRFSCRPFHKEGPACHANVSITLRTAWA